MADEFRVVKRPIIKNALGWLSVPDKMIGVEDDLIAFSDRIRGVREFKHVMLCGMGGSSLCPEVFRQTFGHQEGYPELLVLDSTDPDAFCDIADQIDITKCLFIISSKSGTTTEPLVFYKYWYDQVSKRKENPGECFIAVTDPGTLMEKMATDALASGSPANNPRVPDKAEITALYREVWTGAPRNA
jgi:glucose-6-phosphate isomerase